MTPKHDYELPEYLDGQFMVTGPSKFSMGDTKLNHVLDGFGRISNFKIENGNIEMSSKLIDCKWLKLCQEKNTIIPGITFRETTPPRWMSKIPLMNIIGSLSNFDDNWVMPYRMPDNKTYVTMTDTASMLEFDPKTLETKGMIKWEDDIQGTTGTTHVKTLPNGDLVGVCAEINMKGENKLTAYRIKPDNIKKRIRIGSIDTGK